MMSDNLRELLELAARLGCETLTDEPLSLHTTFRIGGNCNAMIMPKDADSCLALMQAARSLEVRYTVIGNGSNLLCDDRGYNGAVFLIGKAMGEMSVTDGEFIRVGSGAGLSKLSAFACEHCLSGAEFAYGIPGSVGGAVYMNAGAYGGEIKDIIVSCKAVSEAGGKFTVPVEKMELSYRNSVFQSMENIIITSALFRLKKGSKDEISARMKELAAKRKEKQPIEFPSAGSAFKRPTGQFAGKLIQDSGLSGCTVGGAQVSEKHCGFIINKGNATADDVKKLVSHIQKTVMEKTGFKLESEIRFLEY